MNTIELKNDLLKYIFELDDEAALRKLLAYAKKTARAHHSTGLSAVKSTPDDQTAVEFAKKFYEKYGTMMSKLSLE